MFAAVMILGGCCLLLVFVVLGLWSDNSRQAIRIAELQTTVTIPDPRDKRIEELNQKLAAAEFHYAHERERVRALRLAMARLENQTDELRKDQHELLSRIRENFREEREARITAQETTARQTQEIKKLRTELAEAGQPRRRTTRRKTAKK